MFSKIIEKIKSAFVSRYLGSFVRHAMTLLAGYLVGLGVDPALVEKFIASGTEVFIALALYFIAQLSNNKFYIVL